MPNEWNYTSLSSSKYVTYKYLEKEENVLNEELVKYRAHLKRS